MELMKGPIFLIQCAVFALAWLFFVISYGGGVWWESKHNGLYYMSFTLWKICSKYQDVKEQCLSISGDRLESVILSLRACMSIALIFIMLTAMFFIIWFITQLRNQLAGDTWLRARTVLLLLLHRVPEILPIWNLVPAFEVLFELFMLVSIAHAHHCPPCYYVGHYKMESSIAWGWSLNVVSFIFLFFPCIIHCIEQYAVWRSDRMKV